MARKQRSRHKNRSAEPVVTPADIRDALGHELNTLNGGVAKAMLAARRRAGFHFIRREYSASGELKV